MSTAVAPPPVARRAPWLAAPAAVGLIALLVFRMCAGQTGATGNGMPSASGSASPLPVSVVRVLRRDVPITLEGLGNVVPLKTVAVRSQVDGPLQSVDFKEGEAVKGGQLLARIDARPFVIALHQAEATLARDRAQYEEARLNYERYQQLREQKLIAEQQADDQRALADQARASVAVDQAQIENAKLQLDYTKIRSPIDGITGVRLVDPGNLVRAADPNGIVIVTQLDPIGILFSLPQDDQPRVARALAAGSVEVHALSRDGATPLAAGKLLLIDNQVNQATATLRLKAVFSNPSRALWPNAFVKVRLVVETLRQALVVPSSAVQRGPQGALAYVVEPDRSVAVRSIDVSVTEGDWAVLARGLREGDQVVVEGQSQLRPGARVEPHLHQLPAASPSGSSTPDGP